MSRTSRPLYGRFARYYDLIYHALVNYEGDVDFLEEVFRRYTVKPGTILDLGCGTGNHSVPLARRGYRVTGIDRSASMIAQAKKKASRLRNPPRFARADMRTIRLGQRFEAALCLFGAFGYLLTQRDVLQALRSIRSHLEPGGLFVFEFWQGSAARPAPFQTWLDLTREGVEIVRLDESRYDPKTGRLPVEFRFFVRHGQRFLDRFTEIHTIQTYSVPEIRALLRRGKFELLGAFAATNIKKGFGPVTRKTFRVMVVARAK